MTNGITDPRDPDFIPYYQRQGLDAEGVSSEFMETWRKKSAEILARTRPESREAVRIGLGEFAEGQYANLQSYEMREVRRGKVDAITRAAEDSAVRAMWSVGQQTAADIRGRDQELEDARKEYEDAERAAKGILAGLEIPENRKLAEQELADAKARFDERTRQAQADFEGRVKNHFFEMVDSIEETGRQFDAGVAERLYDWHEGRVRKMKAARATIQNMVGSLAAAGHLEAAGRFVEMLEGEKDAESDMPVAGRYGFIPAEVDAMRKTVEQAVKAKEREAHAAAAEAERAAVGEITNISANALARGGMDEIEAARAEIEARAQRMPKGSRLETVALQEAKRLDRAADAEARRLTWDAIVDSAVDGTKWTPPEGSRQAKHYKALKASFDRQAEAYAAEGILAQDAAVQEERKANEAALRAAMLASAAIEPGAFSARLAEAAEKGHITLGQYRRLRDEFRDVWTREGMPQKGAALVQILKNEFYAGKDYDLNDRLAVNPKTGKFEYAKNPDTKKPFEGEEVKLPGYRVETIESVPVPFLMGEFTPVTPQKWTNRKPDALTSSEQLKMLDWAMELALHDGEWISTDPQTGAKLDKPRKLDAAAEFQDACSRLKLEKRAQSSQDMLTERANAMLNLRAGFAQADDAVTGAAAKREAVELKTRETLKSAKRKPFAPKMPGGPRGESAAADGEEE